MPNNLLHSISPFFIAFKTLCLLVILVACLQCFLPHRLSVVASNKLTNASRDYEHYVHAGDGGGASASASSSFPLITVSLLVREKLHSLPYFLGGLERLTYPKRFLRLDIRVEDCSALELQFGETTSQEIIRQWMRYWKSEYHSIDLQLLQKSPCNKSGATTTTTTTTTIGREAEASEYIFWDSKHYTIIMQLRQDTLERARADDVDILFLLDVDVILANQHTLEQLIFQDHEHPQSQLLLDWLVLAPLLNCTNSAGFSNFREAQDPTSYYYQRSDDYFDIRDRYVRGRFPVALVHSAMLLNLRHPASRHIWFYPPETLLSNYPGPWDDIILFQESLNIIEERAILDNKHFFGYFNEPLISATVHSPYQRLEHDIEDFQHLLMQSMLEQSEENHLNASIVFHGDGPGAALFQNKPPWSPRLGTMGLDAILVINLARRSDRLTRMNYNLQVLGLDYRLFPAVDGDQLTEDYLNDRGIRPLPNYKDPYQLRGLKLGEIGCFLSHYAIWKEQANREWETVMIFEDDIRFQSGFVRSLRAILYEANLFQPNWELLYLGRKPLRTNESFVKGASRLLLPGYTYWTLGYVLRLNGAKKLLRGRPLEKILPVDEYLPIMFDQHPNQEWKHSFQPRNLVAISSMPLLLEPIHYTGHGGYSSDTEDSELL